LLTLIDLNLTHGVTQHQHITALPQSHITRHRTSHHNITGSSITSKDHKQRSQANNTSEHHHHLIFELKITSTITSVTQLTTSFTRFTSTNDFTLQITSTHTSG
jgi:hypothetical protein